MINKQIITLDMLLNKNVFISIWSNHKTIDHWCIIIIDNAESENLLGRKRFIWHAYIENLCLIYPQWNFVVVTFAFFLFLVMIVLLFFYLAFLFVSVFIFNILSDSKGFCSSFFFHSGFLFSFVHFSSNCFSWCCL